jgi:hypothetical protein
MCFFEEASVSPIMLTLLVSESKIKIDISKYIGRGQITEKVEVGGKTIQYEVTFIPAAED